MPSIFASMSICTPRAWPGSGSHSEYGKPEPIISSVSQPCIIASLGFVPSRPIEPVTKDRSSGSTSRPLSALATPAPSRTASSSTSAAASRAPCPIRIATRSPLLSTSAARTRSACCGITRGLGIGPPEKTAPWARGGSSNSSSWRSDGMITQVTERVARAIWTARSIRWVTCAGTVAIWTKSLATSLNSETRSTSCW